MKSYDSPAYVVKLTAVGITSIGLKLSNDLLFPTIQVMQTIQPCLAHRNESSRVVVPINSSTLSIPPGHASFTCSAIEPLSMNTWSAPLSRRSSLRSGLRVAVLLHHLWVSREMYEPWHNSGRIAMPVAA